MDKLIEMLPLPEKRSELINDCCNLVDEQVERKKGISGLSIKAGYTILKAFKPGVVRDAIDVLLDDFINALDGLHQDFQKTKPAESFGRFMKSRSNQAAEVLVSVTDQRAGQSHHMALKKGYQKLRPYAVRSVEEAIPALADLMDRNYKS